jgi:hypothetical protein
LKEQERAFKEYIAQMREEIRDIEETSAGICVLLGGNEDCNLGDSISGNSETAAKRQGGGLGLCDFGKSGNTCNQAHIFPKVFF